MDLQDIFTASRMADLLELYEMLFEAQRRGTKICGVGGGGANSLVCLTKVLSVLSSHRVLVERGGMMLIRMVHRGVMATMCPRHAPLTNQDRGLILHFDAANVAPCPDAAAHTVS